MAFKELLRHWTYSAFAPGTLLRSKYEAFQRLLRYDAMCLDLIADLEEIRYGHEHADWERVDWLVRRLRKCCGTLVDLLVKMHPVRHMGLPEYFKKADFYLQLKAAPPEPVFSPPYVLPLSPASASREDGNVSGTAAEDEKNAPRRAPDERRTEALVGGKAANLVRAMDVQGVQAPPCAVVTSNAFNYFLENNDLRQFINRRLRRITLADPELLSQLTGEIRSMILRGDIPAEVAEAIRETGRTLAGAHGLLALRSSAVGEDGTISFAGQYESLLFVPPDKAEAAYRKVIAAKFAPKALTYRLLHGLPDFETPMAVLMMPMVDAHMAGVAYSLDPDRRGASPEQGLASVHVVEGPGAALVSGEVDPQVFRLTRPPASENPERTEAFVPEPGGREMPPLELRKEESSLEAVTRPLLTPQQAAQVAELAIRLESELGHIREIEWAMDRTENLFLLQNRLCPPSAASDIQPLVPPPDTSPLCLGECVSSGQAVGRVFHADVVLDMADVPSGAVLVVRTLTPSLARVVEKVAAVVATAGGRASHFAAIAREFGLPVVGSVKNAFDVLPHGTEVTVDASSPSSGREAAIWPGRLELPEAEDRAGKELRNSLARRMDVFMDLVSTLNLTDPDAPEFSPKHCRSMHDFVRYCHEMSVREMFSLVGKGGRGLSGARRLESKLPISLYLLDLGGGLFPTGKTKHVTPDDIRCAPMWSLWWGLSCKEAKWSEQLPHFDWEEFDRISGGIFDPKSKLLASYAVLSESYLHLMIRFGYHFSQVDSVCGPQEGQNYINFRFKGGGGLPDQRLLRLRFIRAVLEPFGFQCRTRGDMLDATFSRASERDTQKRLVVVGRLLAVTRLMDMGLSEDSDIERLARDFIDRAEKEDRR
jgi:pyruvate,water dikinase